VRGRLRFLGTVAELRDRVATAATGLEELYLELTDPRTGVADDGGTGIPPP
jgi:hypothetical protein